MSEHEKLPRILIVEDDLSILTGLSIGLRNAGFEVIQAQTGRQGLQRTLDEDPDLIVLDIMLPEMNGFEVLEELRKRRKTTPIVALSAKSLERDRVMGLNLGADDYVVKPFGLSELIARIRAVLRRQNPAQELVRFSETVVDLAKKVVLLRGEELELTAQEFKLLAYFLIHPGRTFSREELLAGAWEFSYQGTARTVDNFVSQLRTKLEPDPENPRHFITVRGLGYRFDGSAA